jgi:hypothetical protein
MHTRTLTSCVRHDISVSTARLACIQENLRPAWDRKCQWAQWLHAYKITHGLGARGNASENRNDWMHRSARTHCTRHEIPVSTAIFVCIPGHLHPACEMKNQWAQQQLDEYKNTHDLRATQDNGEHSNNGMESRALTNCMRQWIPVSITLACIQGTHTLHVTRNVSEHSNHCMGRTKNTHGLCATRNTSEHKSDYMHTRILTTCVWYEIPMSTTTITCVKEHWLAAHDMKYQWASQWFPGSRKLTSYTWHIIQWAEQQFHAYKNTHTLRAWHDIAVSTSTIACIHKHLHTVYNTTLQWA